MAVCVTTVSPGQALKHARQFFNTLKNTVDMEHSVFILFECDEEGGCIQDYE